MGEELEATEFVQMLKAARVAIDEALANLGESVDDVSGFGMASFGFHAPMAPGDLVSKLGPAFKPGLVADGDTKCINILCDAPGGAARF